MSMRCLIHHCTVVCVFRLACILKPLPVWLSPLTFPFSAEWDSKNMLAGEAELHREAHGRASEAESESSRRLTSLDTLLICSFGFTARV